MSALTFEVFVKPLLGAVTLDVSYTVPTSLVTGILDAAVSSIVNPLVNRVNNALISQLSALLGLELGGADVFAVPRPICTVPKPVG